MADDTTHDDVKLALRTEELTWTPTDTGVVILDLRTSRYLQLNDSAAVLWQQLEGGTSTAALVETLVTTYEIPADRAGSDVEAFVGILRERDLIAGP